MTVCCDSAAAAWTCQLCNRDTCAIHRPTPAEARLLCEMCAPLLPGEDTE